MGMAQPPLFEIRGVSKRFGPVQALKSVDLEIHPGEVHALVGENGAGKSTLMKILSGAHSAAEGSILIEGRPYRVSSPVEAGFRGVAMIYQELNLAPDLTVAENLVLGRETSRFGIVRDPRTRMRQVLEMLGNGDLELDMPVRGLGIGRRQVVEICRALMSDARLIIMDEPTSSLSTTDTEALFGVIRRLAESGIAIIYISHFLDEIRRVADRYTVLRDGETVATGRMSGASLDTIVKQMVGRELPEMFPRVAHAMGEPVLEVRGLRGLASPEEVSFSLRRGEILGIAGLVGSGRSETVRALFGLERCRKGTMTLKGTRIGLGSQSPRRALSQGLDLLSENRKEEGLATALSVHLNVCLSNLSAHSRFGFLSANGMRRAAGEWRDRLDVKCPDLDQPVASLSGGNQQKIALARILHHDSDVLFLDEPTRGIDVGSKAEICRLIGRLAARGKALVVISSYLPELLGICDTIAVMHRGRLCPPRPADDWSEETIMLCAASGRLA